VANLQIKFVLTADCINIAMIIYKITAPNSKQYIGQTISTLDEKIQWYKKSANNDKTNRYIFNSIRKYGIENMKFEVVEESSTWSKKELDDKEIYYINKLETYYTLGKGYNMTYGGDGLDSESASRVITKWYQTMTEEKKQQKSHNSSVAQKKRYNTNPDSDETREKKKKSHQGTYVIESPEGGVYYADNGLKEFSEQNKEELGVTYWQLFNAYRKLYQDTITIREQKNLNKWKVTRVDK